MKSALLALALLTSGAEAACRQALALGLDVSGSVDPLEYRLQLDGLAGALTSPDVMTQVLAHRNAPVQIAVFEWAGASYQRDLLGWRVLASEADIQAVAAFLRAHERDASRMAVSTATAIGAAMEHGARLLAERPECWSRTLDLSGDGINNNGPFPEQVRQGPLFASLTVNGLVIGSDLTVGRDERQMHIMELSAYYGTRVIHGPGAFIETATGFPDFERTMERKLLREIEGIAVGALE